jgi:hypothetical protein
LGNELVMGLMAILVSAVNAPAGMVTAIFFYQVL